MKEITITVTERYLWLPVHPGAQSVWLDVLCGGQRVAGMEVSLSAQPLWYASMDVSAHHGRTLTLRSQQPLPDAFRLSAELPETLGDERRPVLRFTARSGWLNDPNGLFRWGGQYHLFYQHNPYGTAWGNMHWGHAVSRDLLHWQHLPEALAPDRTGAMFSGCAVVDASNVSRLQQGDTPPMLLYYTADTTSYPPAEETLNSVHIACSTDGGATFRKLEGPSILNGMGLGDRDPKVVWAEELGCWLLTLYKDDARRHAYALYASHDLLHWVYREDLLLPGDMECPDLMPLWLNGDPQEKRWVFWGASGHYMVGRIEEGRLILRETVRATAPFSGEPDYYASQTFHLADQPADGTALQIHWLRSASRGASYNHQMSVPVRLTLTGSDGDERLRMRPAPEFLSALTETLRLANASADQLTRALEGVSLQGTYLRLTLPDAPFELTLAGQRLRYQNGVLTTARGCLTLPRDGGAVTLEAVVDGAVMELFWQDGWQAMQLTCDGKGLALQLPSGARASLSLRAEAPETTGDSSP